MKLFHKMSTRDRSLLILLLAAVVFYLCYTFIMTPAIETAGMLKSNLQAVQDQLVQAEELKGKTQSLQAEERKQKEQLVKKYSVFFYDLKQNRLLNRVDAIHNAVGLVASAYTATPEMASQVPVEIGAYAPVVYPLKDLALKINPELSASEPGLNQSVAAPADQASADSGGAVQSSDMVAGTEVTVGFAGANYESIYNFISSIEKMNKTVVLKNITITKDETGLTGQLVYAFYALPKIDPEQEDGLDYSPSIPMGKANPFN
jgi:Tfp pilus assembly protein PilO